MVFESQLAQAVAGAAGLWVGTAGPAASQKLFITLSKTSFFTKKK